MTQCKLKSLKNFPTLDNLERIELNDNNIGGGLSELVKYGKLKVVKFAGNKIKDFEEIKELSALEAIESLDFLENPISKDKEYSKLMWETFPKLKTLDSCNKEGDEVLSDMDEAGEGEIDLEAEGEGVGDFIDNTEIDEQQRKQLEKQGYVIEGEEGDFEDAEGEDGQDEQELDDTKQSSGQKRTRDEVEEDTKKNKRQKVEE